MKVRPNKSNVTPWKKQAAAKMRSNQSWPEKKLWERLRGSQLGFYFTRQKIILGYIADFYCSRAKLVVEVDGKQHLKKKNLAWDNERDQAMSKIGIKTIRFTAKEIANNLSAVVILIEIELRKRANPKIK